MWRSCERWGGVLLALLFAGCIAKSDPELPQPDDPDSPQGMRSVSIRYLKSCYTGYATALDKEWTIRGTVTANDRYGTFPNTLVIQDTSAGIELKLSGGSLYTTYPIGIQMTVRCRGLVLGAYSGVVSLGTSTTQSAYQNGFISASEQPYYLHLSQFFLAPQPDTLSSFRAISPHHVSGLVAFERVQFVEQEGGLAWCDAGADTDRHLVDTRGDTLKIRTQGEATFASTLLPQSSGYVEGILSYFGGRYQLRILHPKWLVMESARFVPLRE